MVGKKRVLAATLLGGIAASLGSGSASAQYGRPLMTADASKLGFIGLYVVGEPGARMSLAERVGDRTQPLSSVVLDGRGEGMVPRAARWRCDRAARRFVAVGLYAGKPAAATYGTRTPSCRARLSVGLPRRVAPGASVGLALRDRWRIGGLRLRLCLTRPGGDRRCRALRIQRDRARVTTRFRANRKGRWRIELSAPGLSVSRQLSVGGRPAGGSPHTTRPSILVTGDSLMQGIDSFLADRFATRARVRGDIRLGAGVSKPGLDWVKLAREQARRRRPDATVVFLGANEGFPLPSASGQTVPCCGAEWVAAYVGRVRSMMGAYTRGGKGKVLWIAGPAPRGESRRFRQFVINGAFQAAARGLPGVRILRLDRVFTPGGRFRSVIPYRGGRVRVREADGIHLSLAGAKIAAAKVAAALKAFRVVR